MINPLLCPEDWHGKTELSRLVSSMVLEETRLMRRRRFPQFIVAQVFCRCQNPPHCDGGAFKDGKNFPGSRTNP